MKEILVSGIKLFENRGNKNENLYMELSKCNRINTQQQQQQRIHWNPKERKEKEAKGMEMEINVNVFSPEYLILYLCLDKKETEKRK